MSDFDPAPVPGGVLLRALRKTYNKTQLDVELEASLGIGYLQRLELGKIQQPEHETLMRIVNALGASFAERSAVFRKVGYILPVKVPDDLEIEWAIQAFHSELTQESLPAYLLDCSHRILAWNRFVPKVFHVIEHSSDFALMPRLIFDPLYEIEPFIVNTNEFFLDQVQILLYEKQRCVEDVSFNTLIDDMRKVKVFDTYWRESTNITSVQPVIRPLTRLEINTHDGLLHFWLISQPFAQDPRFRVIRYLPADTNTTTQCLTWSAHGHES